VLSLLPEAEFAPAFDAVQLSRVRPDTWILRQGDPGTSFFVLARGSLEVTTARDGETVKLTQLSDGAIFGELVLLSDAPRSASVRALSDCDLLVFDRDRLHTAAGELQHLRPALQGFARDRLLTNVTQTSPLFRPLDPRQRVDLVRRFISVESGAGQRIIQEGDQGQGLYVVLRGTVDISRNGRRVAQLGAADLFGEMSMIRREPTSASVLAGEHGTSLLFLHRDYFERLIEAVPELRGYFEQLSKSRLSELLSAARETDPPGEEIEVELLF
jgi:CRP-like cAMP-binding protein